MGSDARCPNCGKEVIAGSRFCVHCGTKLMDEQQSGNAFYVAKDIEPEAEHDSNDSIEDSTTDKERNRFMGSDLDSDMGSERENIQEGHFSQNALKMNPPDQLKKPELTNRTPSDSDNKKDRKKLIMIIGTVAVIVIVAVVVLFFVFRRTTDDVRADAMNIYNSYNGGTIDYDRNQHKDDEIEQIARSQKKAFRRTIDIDIADYDVEVRDVHAQSAEKFNYPLWNDTKNTHTVRVSFEIQGHGWESGEGWYDDSVTLYCQEIDGRWYAYISTW